MPLHTTVHYDGRVAPGGRSPRSGIHDKVDALIQKLPVTPDEVAARVKPQAFEALWPAILAELDRSHALVDKTYDLEPVLPGRYEPLPENPRLREFARDRLEAAVGFIASLYLTAWRDSARLPLPEWHLREREATEAGRYTIAAPASRPSSQPVAGGAR